MIITISGFHGTGKTTIGKLLADKLGLDFYSTGKAFRELAEENDMSLEEFSKYAEKNPELDKKLDKKVVNMGKSKDNIVIESLLSSFLLKDIADYRILLKAPLETRIKRMMERDDSNYQRKLKETKLREKSEIERFKEFYNINLLDKDLRNHTFNIIIDTGDLTIDQVLNEILLKIENLEN